jgi:predicted oxidoreductase
MQKPKLILGTMRLGSWGANFSVDGLISFLHQVLEAGIDRLDSADIYGDHSTNALLGRAFAQSIHLARQFKVIGKAGILMPQSPGNVLAKQYYNNSARYLSEALDQMLLDLRIEQLDQFLIHRIDHLMQLEELARFVESAKSSGKVRLFGVSNASLEQARALQALNPCANQLSVSLADLSAVNQLISYQNASIEVQAYSPLQRPESVAFNDASNAAKQLLSLDDAQLAIAWLVSIPGVTPVIGTTQIDRVRALVHAARVSMTHAHWYALYAAARGSAME